MSVSAHAPQPDYDRARGRAVLVFADDPAARARLADAARDADGRVVERAALSAAAAAIAGVAGSATAIVALARDGGGALDRLLDEIADAVDAARLDAVVIAPAALIDLVAARLDAVAATLLIDPSPAEIATAVAALVAPRRAIVAEPGGDDERRRLAELSEETARIARALASLSEGRDAYRGGGPSGPGAARAADAVADPAVLLAAVRGMIRTRRMRDQYFDAALFADPVWDMLLDLYAARLEGRQVAVSSLCIAAAVPPTTALRWIAMMTRDGLIVRRPDPADRRRMFLALGERAADAMAGYVAATLRHLAPGAA